MIDKAHLMGKPVLFRLSDAKPLYFGHVKSVESDGFWIYAPDMLAQMAQDSAWSALFQRIEGTPILFVPTASIGFLIASGV